MPDLKCNDINYMKTAIHLAKKAEGLTSPNPSVGCVIVKNGRIIGKGYHKKAGAPHAEIMALDKASGNVRGAVMYVTLEPCDHYGRTPPCTKAIISAGIKKVVVGMKDPNPINNGRGLRRLKRSGVSVISGVCEEDAVSINKPYIKHIRTGLPYVTLKIAESLDGKIATARGESRWISGEVSRKYVRRMRSRADAVMVGINTVRKDDPGLMPEGYTARPARIVIDTNLGIPLGSKLVRTASRSQVVIATSGMVSRRKRDALIKRGVDVIRIRRQRGRVSMKDLLRYLGRRGIQHILVEGGAEIAGSLCDRGLVDRFIFFIAPKIIGGRNGISSIKGDGINRLKDARILSRLNIKRSGDDIMVCGER